MRAMKWLIILAILPFATFAQDLKLHYPHQARTKVKTKSNILMHLDDLKAHDRTIDFPTQIIRMKVNVEQLNLSCEQVNATIDDELLDHIPGELFMYTTYVSCLCTDDECAKATAYEIHSYFDPINDKAVDYTKRFLAEHNGVELLGGKINIESARGLVVSLHTTTGIKKNPDERAMMMLGQESHNFHFKNNYEMAVKLITDIYDHFYTNDPKVSIPFYDRWFSVIGVQYQRALAKSNYAEVFPDKIFVMNQGEEIFVSNLNYYFVLDCNRFANHLCLV